MNEEGTERNKHRHGAPSPGVVFSRVWQGGGVELVSTLHISQLFYTYNYTCGFHACQASESQTSGSFHFHGGALFSASVATHLFLFFSSVTWSKPGPRNLTLLSVLPALLNCSLEWWVVQGLWGNHEQF